MKKNYVLIGGIAATIAIAGCAGMAAGPSEAEADAAALAMVKSSFREQGIAKLDRIEQDEAQKACSSEAPPPAAVAQKIEAAQLATVKWPSDGKYLGDWKEGEKLAQNGRGMTWTDPAGAPSGGNC
jgi:L-cysteine S-thiosulfotransferase